MAFTDPRSKRENIGKAILKGLQNLRAPPLDDLHAIMYWAVANDCLALVQGCIRVDKSILQMKREGANWLHIAASHKSSKVIPFLSKAGVYEMATNLITPMHSAAGCGSLETAEELFKLVVTGCPIKTSHAKVSLVMQQNAWDNTPLSISVSGRHKAVRDLFW
ncbi:hypothetical protein DER44DRAFT_366291 [Fusarium oxysporum]|nr:hypothetical protein DER44DRAFT_366291 [Fusarium oxysporum]